MENYLHTLMCMGYQKLTWVFIIKFHNNFYLNGLIINKVRSVLLILVVEVEYLV